MRISHLCLLTFFCFGTAHAAPKAVPAIAEPLSQKDGLQVSIGNIELRPSDPHINVVLQNTSDRPINIFNEENSWGFLNLSLEITVVDNKILAEPLIVSREQRVWRGNVFSFQTIAPGEAIVREMRLPALEQSLDSTAPATSKKVSFPPVFYEDFPVPTQHKRRQITMRAVFANDDSISDGGKTAWTGHIASPFKDYNVFWDAD